MSRMLRNRLFVFIVVALLVGIAPSAAFAGAPEPRPEELSVFAPTTEMVVEDGMIYARPTGVYGRLIVRTDADGETIIGGMSMRVLDGIVRRFTSGGYMIPSRVDSRYYTTLVSTGIESLQLSMRGNDLNLVIDGIAVVTIHLDGATHVTELVETSGIIGSYLPVGTAAMVQSGVDLMVATGFDEWDMAILIDPNYTKPDATPIVWPEHRGNRGIPVDQLVPATATPSAVKSFSVTVLAGEGTNMVLNRLVRDGVDRGCANDAIELYRMTNDAWDPGTEVPIPAACVPQALGGTLAPSAVPTQLGQ